MNSLVAGLRAELEVTGRKVTLSVLVLGLIGTDSNVNRGDQLAARTMPVAACSSEMLCAIDSRLQTAFIPQMLSPYSTLIHFLPQLSTPLLQKEYLSAWLLHCCVLLPLEMNLAPCGCQVTLRSTRLESTPLQRNDAMA
jgi:hypothetical protein